MTIYPLEVHGPQFSGVLIGLRGSPTTLLSPQPLRGGYRTKSSDLLPLFLGSEEEERNAQSGCSQTKVTIQLSLKYTIKKRAVCADTTPSYQGPGEQLQGLWQLTVPHSGLFSSLITMAIEIHGYIVRGRQFFTCISCASYFLNSTCPILKRMLTRKLNCIQKAVLNAVCFAVLS